MSHGSFLAIFLKKNCHQDFLKTTQSGHTGLISFFLLLGKLTTDPIFGVEIFEQNLRPPSGFCCRLPILKVAIFVER